MDGQARFPRQRSASGSGPVTPGGRLPRGGASSADGPARIPAPAPGPRHGPGPGRAGLPDGPGLPDQPEQHDHGHQDRYDHDHDRGHAHDDESTPDEGSPHDDGTPDREGAPAYEPGCVLHHRLHAAFAPADLVAVGAIRHRLRAALGHWGVPELADTAELLTSELVTNALLHTTKGAVLEAVLTAGQRLRIEVQDCTTRLPGRRVPEEWATSGRGLMLVDSLADAWGVQLRGEGKVTWFELGPAGADAA
ncbi:ATP-binding protein [Kitasatospora sp. NPDC048540]|uniref:ATP-binding protein n=1 Tax=unclassified Kitasatospora TaxID=2633591 RepID=UPI0009E89C05|nr:ATP-binding protein [Kitasatospora sp. MBT63]